MNILGDRLRELRLERRKTLADMEKETGLKASAISNYENGIRTPKREPMEILTDYFNVDTDYLLGKTDIRNSLNLTGIFKAGYEEALGLIKNVVSIPVYSCLSCGRGSWIDEEPEDLIGVPHYMMFSGQGFANPAEGDSMEPGIHSGDLLIFKQQSSIESGEIGSFSLNGTYYCKRFKRLADGSVWLFSDNPAYDPIPVRPTDDFRTLGLYRLKLSKEQ